MLHVQSQCVLHRFVLEDIQAPNEKARWSLWGFIPALLCPHCCQYLKEAKGGMQSLAEAKGYLVLWHRQRGVKAHQG